MSRKKSVIGIFIGLPSRIRKIRGKLTQTEFAKILGVSQGTINKYEKGTILPGEDILKKISHYGHVSVEWLLHGEERRSPPADQDNKAFELSEAEAAFEHPLPCTSELKEPFVYGAIDTAMLAQIIAEVDRLLMKRKRELSPMRRAHLYSLLYDRFQITGKIPDRAKIEEFLDLAG